MKFSANLYEELFGKVWQHRVAMKLPINPDWKQEVLRQMCPKLPKGWCIGMPAPPPPSPDDRRKAYDSSLKTREASGLTPLTFDRYETLRHAVCLTCNNFRGEHGIGLIACAGCGCTHLKAWATETECPNVKLGQQPRWLDSDPMATEAVKEMKAFMAAPPPAPQAPLKKRGRPAKLKSADAAGGKK